MLLSKKKIPKRGTTTKDGELVEMQIHFHFKKECLRNTKFKISELLIPELYSYNKVDVELMERKSGVKFPSKLISKFKISSRYCALKNIALLHSLGFNFIGE